MFMVPATYVQEGCLVGWNCLMTTGLVVRVVSVRARGPGFNASTYQLFLLSLDVRWFGKN